MMPLTLWTIRPVSFYKVIVISQFVHMMVVALSFFNACGSSSENMKREKITEIDKKKYIERREKQQFCNK